jgi:hypothetical protein
LLRFRRPTSYKTNELPSTNVQMGLAYVDGEILKRGLRRLAEALDCIGGQLAHPSQGKLLLGLEAALLLDQIQKEFPSAFDGDHFWNQRVPGLMNTFVVSPLRNAHGVGYHYSGLDAVEEAVANVPLVQKYLEPEGG